VGSNLAALINVLLVIVIAVIPITIIVTSLIGEGAALVQRMQDGNVSVPGILTRLEERLPDWADGWIEATGLGNLSALREQFGAALSRAGQYLAGRAVNVGQNTLRFFASVGIMLYVLFFLFRDGRNVARNIRDAMPLSDDYSRRLISMFATVVRATVKGNIIIAVAQGTIGGVAFWLLGIQGALLWGVVMTFLSMLPAVGSALVWLPFAIFFLASGAIAKGLILIVIGIAVIGLVDNLMRPKLVGKDTRLPDYVVLVSTLGGLVIFGLNGFVIGPLIAALFIAVWTLFREEQKGKRGRPIR
jgi:predicted PurR-regulated permease PerM